MSDGCFCVCRTCGQQSSCVGVNRKTAVAAAVVNVNATGEADRDVSETRWNCLCDDACTKYGDCCTDSPLFEPVEQQRAAIRYSCVRTASGTGVYAAAKCPDGWLDLTVKAGCETPGGIDRDGMLDNPVTSRVTGLTYRNRFCAACHRDVDDSALWNAQIVCQDLFDVPPDGPDRAAVRDSLRRADDGRWTVEYRGKPYDCEPTVVPPDTVRARPCQPGVVSECHPKWPDVEMRSNCEAYTTVVYNGDRPYKNAHCAICNNVPVQNLTCDLTEVHYRFPLLYGARSFTALFKAEPGHPKCHGNGKFYDPFAETCRPLVPGAEGMPLNCSVVVVYPAPTVAGNWSSTSAVEYVTLDNGSLAVCADHGAGPEPNSEAYRSVALTYVGLGVSTVFLVVHLAVFAALPEMKNLSGKNLASLCVALLCSYAAFLAGNWLSGPACYAVAALTYYAFVASFAWMLVMSFDCWRTLRLATVKLRVTSGRQTKKFLVYSAVCWLVPAMLTFVAVVADMVSAVPDDFRPRFSPTKCWFGSKTALLTFFVGPLAAVMSVNFVLFAWTAYLIHSSRATVRHVNTRHVRRDFRLYCRLAVLMGLTWATGILASFTDKGYLWVLFVALNTFQGLFVFVAFTCRRRVLDALMGAGRGQDDGRAYSVDPEKDNRNRRTPGSWSSTDNSLPISSEKTSDTLY